MYKTLTNARSRTFLTVLSLPNNNTETLESISPDYHNWLIEYYNSNQQINSIKDIPFYLSEFSQLLDKIKSKDISDGLFYYNIHKINKIYTEHLTNLPYLMIEKPEDGLLFKYKVGEHCYFLSQKEQNSLNRLPFGYVYGYMNGVDVKVICHISEKEYESKVSLSPLINKIEDMRKFCKAIKIKSLSPVEAKVIYNFNDLCFGENLICEIDKGFFDICMIKY